MTEPVLQVLGAVLLVLGSALVLFVLRLAERADPEERGSGSASSPDPLADRPAA